MTRLTRLYKKKLRRKSDVNIVDENPSETSTHELGLENELPAGEGDDSQHTAPGLGPLRIEGVSKNSGMVAIYPSDYAAEEIHNHFKGMPSLENKKDLHVTLVYLGKDLTDEQWQIAEDVCDLVADTHEGMWCKTQGVGVFDHDNDGRPFYCSVDASGLAAMRTDIVEELSKRGVEVPSEYDFTPHMTIAYLADLEKINLDKGSPNVRWECSEICLVRGNETIHKSDLSGHAKEAGGFGFSLHEITSPGKGDGGLQPDSPLSENTQEDPDLKLGDVEDPYSMGDGAMSPNIDDDKKYDIVKGAQSKPLIPKNFTPEQEQEVKKEMGKWPQETLVMMDRYLEQGAEPMVENDVPPSIPPELRHFGDVPHGQSRLGEQLMDGPVPFVMHHIAGVPEGGNMGYELVFEFEGQNIEISFDGWGAPTSNIDPDDPIWGRVAQLVTNNYDDTADGIGWSMCLAYAAATGADPGIVAEWTSAEQGVYISEAGVLTSRAPRNEPEDVEITGKIAAPKPLIPKDFTPDQEQEVKKEISKWPQETLVLMDHYLEQGAEPMIENDVDPYTSDEQWIKTPSDAYAQQVSNFLGMKLTVKDFIEEVRNAVTTQGDGAVTFLSGPIGSALLEKLGEEYCVLTGGGVGALYVADPARGDMQPVTPSGEYEDNGSIEGIAWLWLQDLASQIIGRGENNAIEGDKEAVGVGDTQVNENISGPSLDRLDSAIPRDPASEGPLYGR